MSDGSDPFGGGDQSLNGFKFINTKTGGSKQITFVMQVENGKTPGDSAAPQNSFSGWVARVAGTSTGGATSHISQANNNTDYLPANGVMEVQVYDGQMVGGGDGQSAVAHAGPPFYLFGQEEQPAQPVATMRSDGGSWFEDAVCTWVETDPETAAGEYVWSASPG